MSSISPALQSVLDLFKGPLNNVRFADIDAEGLAGVAAEVEAAGEEVQRQEEQLAALRQTLAQRQEALLSLAQQALAYARVYAEHDERLLDELNRIALPRAAKPRKPGAANGATRASRTEPNADAAGAGAALDGGEEPLEPAAADGCDSSEGKADGARPRNGRKVRGRAAQATAG